MTDMPVLAVKEFAVTFDTPDGPVHAVKNVSFNIKRGECLGIVGESGSGKSQTFLGAFGLLPANGRADGVVKFQGRDVVGLSRKEYDAIRGREVAFVFQDPLTALTPHLKIGEQLSEVLAHHFSDKFGKGGFRNPAEFFPGLGCVTEQGFHFGRTKVAGIDSDDTPAGLVVTLFLGFGSTPTYAHA